jgi:glycosyltransferase involved in cell wall biosynthesis
VKFAVITHLLHKRDGAGSIGGYAPYIREMDLWIRHVDQCVIVAPQEQADFLKIDRPYAEQGKIKFVSIPQINFTGPIPSIKAVLIMPVILFKIAWVMCRVNHIHLRCPGNIGLLGCLLQILFPFKKKTAKYAGNWSDYIGQPRSYRIQTWILSNTLVTKNRKVLVYGEWPNQSRNVVSFFTASYSVADLEVVPRRSLSGIIKLVFVGTLTSNKNPLYSIHVVEGLTRAGCAVEIEMLGEGKERAALEEYVRLRGIENKVFFRGNVDPSAVKDTLRKSHFLIFLSESEGWPKAVAESMFWGCVPVVQPVSCLRWMLGTGERGVLTEKSKLGDLLLKLQMLIGDPAEYAKMSARSMEWSRQYTLEKFESEIKKFI